MATKTEQAFKTIDGLEYSKEWDTSGASIVLRETWSEAGTVVRQVEHNFAEDHIAARRNSEPAEPTGADVVVDLTGVQANAETGKL